MKSQAMERCPRCDAGRLHRWQELSEEEQIIALRMNAAAAGYTLDERKALHRWCPRCWYEATGGAQAEA